MAMATAVPGPAVTPLVEARGISKSFPGIRALSGVSMNVLPGEVHALVGENGAGKSTLMQILAGVYQPDEGELLVEGRPVTFANRRDAERAGIGIVFQELSLVPQLSVAENVFAGRQPTGRFRLIDVGRMNREAAAALAPFGVAFGPTHQVGELSMANQQIVEIAKAISLDSRVLILDEPTSSLTANEAARLFDAIRDLRARGLGMVYISHHLREVFAIADRITVLRDGECRGTWTTAETTEQAIVSEMVGRAFSSIAAPYAPRTYGEEVLLETRGLIRAGEFSDIDLTLHEGEILGIAGLVGAGRSELAQTLFGLTKPDSGDIIVSGRPVRFSSPADAIAAGMGMLTEDRKQAGLFLAMSVAWNVAAPNLRRFSDRGLMDDPEMDRVAADYMAQLRIRARDVDQKVIGLSGGNQQKVLLAMWLATGPRILIVDEPTRGVDVGAKAEIHQLLIGLANEGVGVIVISSELPEVLHLADTVVVMHRGEITARFRGGEADEDTVLGYAAGVGGDPSAPRDGAGAQASA